jgi:WD40 repeat protein
MLASGGDDGTVKLWSIPELKEVAALNGHNDIIFSISFSPDGKVLASGSEDGALNIWDIATRKQVSAIPGHMENVRSLSFSPDGSMIASGGWDRAVRLWSVQSWQEIQAFEHSGSISSVSFSSDGNILGASCQGGKTSTKLWSVPERKEIATLSGHRDYIFSISFSPDGGMLASGSDDGTVKVWSLRTYQEIATLEHEKTVFALSFSPNGEILAIADAEVKLWSVPDWQEIATFDEGYSEAIECIAFSPDSTILATGGGSWEDFVRLWSVPDGEEIARLEGHTWIVQSVAFSPDGRMLASASRDETIKLWSIPDGEEIGMLRGHKWRVNSVSFSPDGKTLASGSEDGTILLWDLQPYIDRLYNITAQEPEEAAVNPKDKAAILIGNMKNAGTTASLPSHFALGQNYPNPFNPGTWIPYQLAEDAHVFIRIYDSTGRCISNLDLGHRSAGFCLDRDRAAYWDGKNYWGEKAACGIYLYQLEAGDFSAVGRLYILK